MSKQIIQRYTFAPAARTITLTDLDTVSLPRLGLITNIATNTIIYNFADPTRRATLNGNVLTLTYDTTAMNASDPLRIDYDTVYDDVAYDKVTVGNARVKFRDGFATPGAQPNTGVWDMTSDDAGHLITQGGDSSGSSYLRISLSPFVDNSSVTLTSKRTFRFPNRIGYGLTTSQRILGQEVFFGLIATNAAGALDYTAAVADKSITGATASITSNVATFTMTNHGLKGGDRVEIEFCVDKRLNVGPVTVTIIDQNTFTVPCTLANGTYNSTGGVVRNADPLKLARNGAGLLLENTTTTNASFVSRRNGSKFRSLNSGIATTQATQSNTNPYTDAFNAAAVQELYYSIDEVSYRSYSADSTTGMTGYGKYNQGIPDEDPDYKIHFRATNLTGITRPVARISAIAKTGTTTATVTTIEPHGLATTDWVQIYGVRDQTNFPNLTAGQTAVASVIDANNFTIVIGGAVTASSAGGAVWQVQGSVLAPGAFNASVQSIARTAGVLTVTMNSTGHGVSSANYGEFHHLWGMDSAGTYEGAYKLLRVNGAALEYENPGADVATINTGGALIKRTDVRLHYARVMDYTRLGVEVLGGKGNTNDSNNAVPTTVVGSVPATQSTGSSSTQWNAAGYAGLLVADVASAAITTTATTSTITPGAVANLGVYAHSFNVIVTAVSGTTPTLDVGVEESLDNGTNWVRVYDFPRITATGAYTSPLIRAQYGTRYRYVQTVGGTTPSFTRAINRLEFSSSAPLHRQFFDRSLVWTTLNSTTPTYNVDGANRLMVAINVGAITTTAPVLQLEGSEEGTTWYAIGAGQTAVASSTIQATYVDQALPKYVRCRVSTAGVGVTNGYISIKALGA